MKMINCPKNHYLQHKAKVSYWSKEHPDALNRERSSLSNPALGLIPHDVIKNTEFGRQVHPGTWLMVLRAHTRGHLALPRLLGAPQFGQEERNGRQVRVRLAASLEAKAEALAKQGALLQTLMEKCPLFFAGMLVPEEPKKEAA